MHWTPVSSTNVHSHAYNPDTRELHVRFHSGHTYTYADVPPETADGLTHADSAGKFVNDNLKGVYEYKRVT